MPSIKMSDAETNITELNLDILFDIGLYSENQGALKFVLNDYNRLTQQISLMTKFDTTSKETCGEFKKTIQITDDAIEARNKLVLKYYGILLLCQKKEFELQQNTVKRSSLQARSLSNQSTLSDIENQKSKSWLIRVGDFGRYSLISTLGDAWPLWMGGIMISVVAVSGTFLLALLVVGLATIASSFVFGAINSGFRYSRTKKNVEQAYSLAQTTADSLEKEYRSLTSTDQSIRTLIQLINLDTSSSPEGSAQRFFKPENFESPNNSQVKTQDAQTETGKYAYTF